MIARVSASLSITTEHPLRKVGHLTDLLGITPTDVWEYGDPWGSKNGPDRVRSHGCWRFAEGRTIGSEEDPHGMESLVRLAQRFEPHADTLGGLGEDYSIRVSMFGESDSSQAGFSVGPATMRRLGLLHAAFVPDIYLNEELTARDFE